MIGCPISFLGGDDMYGKLITSNGFIEIAEEEVEKSIVLDKTVHYLNIVISNNCNLYLNNSTDFIYLPRIYNQPFEIRGIPIWTFTIKKIPMSVDPFQFSYYGFY